MKKFVKGICYKQPELDVNTKYHFFIRKAAISDDVVQLFIEARFRDEDGFEDNEFFLEEIPVNSQLFEAFIDQIYPTEADGIIEVNPEDFNSFSCYGYVEIRRNGEIGISWNSIELEESVISAIGILCEELIRPML